MKKLEKLLLVLVLIASSIILINTTKIKANDIDDLDALILKGSTITSEADSQVYIWINNVQTFIEQYSNIYPYSYINNYCNDVKRSSWIDSTDISKILGGLKYLKYKLTDNTIKTPLELIGNIAITEGVPDSDIYLYMFQIIDLANNESSVSNNTKNIANDVLRSSWIDHTDISKLIANLTIMDEEIAISSILQELNITKLPNKIVYTEGETFNPTGVELTAIFNNTYKDGTNKVITKIITDYQVDTTKKLTTSDKYITFSYNYNGSTYSVDQKISVEEYVPELVSKVLTSIEVTSQPNKTEYLIGEYFDSTGLKVSAKYKNIYSDNSTTYTTENNIKFTVDEDTTLTKSDKSWTISYYDDGITVETVVKIKVKSSDPVLNNANVELTPGDVFKLNVLGTDKYVMYKCQDSTNIIELTTEGYILARRPGTVKIIATIGSGKKNTKLTCTVTVKSKITTDKKVIFMNSDEYETLKIKPKKNEYKVYNNYYNNIQLIKDEKIDNLYQILPSKTNYSYNTMSIITVNSYISDDYYKHYRNCGFSNYYHEYIEQKIPVFLYCDNSKKLKLNIYESKNNDGKFSSATIEFIGNYNDCIVFYNEKLYKQFKKSLKEIKDNINNYSSNNYYEITKAKFEKLIKKYVKSKNYSIDSEGYIIIR